MRRLRMAAALTATVLLIGCGQDKGPQGITAVSQEDADQLNASRSRFESANDPVVTADTHFAAGNLAESQGNLPRAVEQYEKAMKIDPSHRNALYRLGVLYAQLKQYPQAIATWKNYLKITNTSAAAYSNIGFCYELSNQPAEAEAAYRQGIIKDPANVACRVNYGLMLARQGKTPEALIQLQKALTPAEAHYNLASVYEQQGHKDHAKAEYRKALQLDPGFVDAQTRLNAME